MNATTGNALQERRQAYEDATRFLDALKLGQPLPIEGLSPERLNNVGLLISFWAGMAPLQHVFDVAQKIAKRIFDAEQTGTVSMEGVEQFWNSAPKSHYGLVEHYLSSLRNSGKQKRNAERPRSKRPYRKKIIELMRSYRLDGGSLDDFIDSACQGSISGLEIEVTGRPGINGDIFVFTIDVEKNLEDHTATRRTVESWWTDAGK